MSAPPNTSSTPANHICEKAAGASFGSIRAEQQAEELRTPCCMKSDAGHYPEQRMEGS